MPSPWRSRALLGAGALALVGLGWWLGTATGSHQTAPEAAAAVAPVDVQVASIGAVGLLQQAWFPGTVRAVNEAEVASNGEGVLTHVLQVGDRFQAGQTLARIDGELIRLRTTEAEADVQMAAANVEQAKLDLRRKAQLAERGFTSRATLDAALSERKQAQSALSAAVARRALSNEHMRRTRLPAPFTGVVAERLREPGEHVSPGNPILRIHNPDRLYLEAELPTGEARNLAVGDMVVSEIDGAVVRARVSALAPAAGNSRRLTLRASLAPGSARISESARVGVPSDRKAWGVTAPRDALVIRQDGAFVFKVVGARAVRVPVKVGQGDAQRVIVSSPALTVGDVVVVRGAERLEDGQAVRATAPPSATAERGSTG